MIRAENLSKKIGSKQILRDVNIHIRKSEFVTVFGPNGAGKSTLMKNLSLLMKPSKGELYINGLNTVENSVKLRNEIGVISHNSFLYDNLTAQENLEFYGRMYEVPDLRDRVYDVIKEVGLEFSFKDPVRTFSRGMLQRLSIARAILHKPSILFLDEPYTGLDQHAIEILNKVLANLNDQERTIFMITHNFEEGLGMSSRIMIVVKGTIAYEASTLNLGRNELKEIYLDKVAGA